MERDRGGSSEDGLRGTLEALERAVEARRDVAAAYVYGSTARGRATPLSDVDVALLYAADVTDARRRRRVASRVAAALAEETGAKRVEIRDIEDLPLAVQGEVLSGGVRACSTDDVRRVRFETDVRQRYLDFLPFRGASVAPALEALRARHLDG